MGKKTQQKEKQPKKEAGNRFSKAAKTHPHKADIESERELIELLLEQTNRACSFETGNGS